MADNNEQSQYYIKKAVLATTNDQGSGCVSLDIVPIIAELHLFEDIRLPYVTGLVTVADPDHMLDLLGFSGTETLDLSVKSSVSLNGPEVNKKFFIRKVATLVEDKTMYTFVIVEEHGFFWATTCIKDTYHDKMEKIVASLLKNWMNKEVENFYVSSESVQNEIVYHCNNKSLRDIIPELTFNMCTSKGMPYFVYGTLYDDKIQMSTLDDLWDQDPFNCQPFVYSPMYMQSVIAEGNVQAELYNIISYDPKTNREDYQLYEKATINVEITSFDVNTNTAEMVNYDDKNAADIINLLSGDGGTGRLVSWNPTKYQLNGLEVKDVLKSYQMHIKTSGQIQGGFSFPERNYKVEVGGQPAERLWKDSKFLREELTKNMIAVMVPGPAFFESQASVGSKVDMIFAKEDEHKQDERGSVDDSLTGQYLITNIKHMFINQSHIVQMIISKYTEKA